MTLETRQSNQLLQKDLNYIKEKVDSIEKKMEADYVTKDALMLVKQECFSRIDAYEGIKKKVDLIITLIITAVVGALLSLIIRQ